jgi:integrase
MARKPSVRYFDSRGAYYCQFRGKQHELAKGPEDFPSGPTYLAALEAFRQVMALGRVEQAGEANTVRAVMETYMQHASARLKGETLTRKMYLLRPFIKEFGEAAVGSLTHLQVYRFIDRQKVPRWVKGRSYSWGTSSVVAFVAALGSGFNWAVRAKLIPSNPIQGIERPQSRSRSRDCLVSAAQHEAILKESRAASMRNLIVALENTGARPGELVHATANDWDDGLKAIVYYADDRRREDEFRHKTAGHKDRVIRFTGAALDMMRTLVGDRPKGVLFPSSRGRPYAKKAVQSCFVAIRDRVGMPLLTAYSYRHTFATNWLLAGNSIDILAELLGNTPATIRKHYSHLCSDRNVIRQHLEKFMAERK